MLNSHSVARTLIATIGAGLTGVFTATPAVAAATGAALITTLSEWVGTQEGNSGLSEGVQQATEQLAKELEGKHWGKVDKAWALSVCGDALSHASPEALRELLVMKPDSAAVAALLQDRHLSFGERDQVVKLMAAALRTWHKYITDTEPLLGTLRDQLSKQIERWGQQQIQLDRHRRDIDILALQGVELPLAKHYQSSDAPSRLFRPEYRVLPLQG